jgi:hypothetical protein
MSALALSAEKAGVNSVSTPCSQLDDFTDQTGRTLLGAPQNSRVERKGVLLRTVYLDYRRNGWRPTDCGPPMWAASGMRATSRFQRY